ncbi:MAG: Rossmann-like domain-containing protein, partial [Candidatus Methylomirabilia bacterium]
AGRLAGQDAWALARDALSPVPLRRAVGVAVLNALSARAMAHDCVPGGRLLSGVDALEAADVYPEDRVAMVGAFIPFIKALKARVARLWVVDKHRDALKPDEVPFWRPPEHVTEVLSQATVAVITGSALVEGGIDSLLSAAGGARKVVLAGPTASPWPPPFFERGVHVLGGIRVLDGRKMLQVVSEGGSGYFFETFAEKICVVRESQPVLSIEGQG